MSAVSTWALGGPWVGLGGPMPDAFAREFQFPGWGKSSSLTGWPGYPGSRGSTPGSTFGSPDSAHVQGSLTLAPADGELDAEK